MQLRLSTEKNYFDSILTLFINLWHQMVIIFILDIFICFDENETKHLVSALQYEVISKFVHIKSILYSNNSIYYYSIGI